MRCVSIAGLLWLAACAVSDRFEDGDARDAGPAVSTVLARGSASCRAWQRAFCDFAADRCGILPRPLCDDQQRGIECRDDGQAEQCALDFTMASCERPPLGCEVIDVADRKPAAEACDVYFDALCMSNVRCGLFDNLDSCRIHPLFEFDCSSALSIDPDYEECLRALDNRACNESVPICDGVIRAG